MKAATPPASKAGSPAPAAPKPAAAPAREPAGKGKDAAKGFVALQTGLFADAANAQGQAAKLRGRGIPACLVEDELEIVIQVNGKVRDKITVSKDATKEEIEALALGRERIQEHTAGLTVRKVIVVPGRLVSVVAN